jgi:arsenate reductase (thioredoxin)
MKKALEDFCAKRCEEFDGITEERKLILKKIAAYIKYKEEEPINLLFVCTHNSRRSIFGQVWAKVASHYFGLANVQTYSGGTEVTAFHANAFEALVCTGFDVKVEGDNENAIHFIIFDQLENAAICFSKLVDDTTNPSAQFGAIMTCNHADKNCPFVTGSELRVSLPYVDPKFSDNTDIQMETYLKTSKEIATEMLYLFSISIRE